MTLLSTDAPVMTTTRKDKDEMTKTPYMCHIFEDIKYDDGGLSSDASLKVMHRMWWCTEGGDAPQVVMHRMW